MSLVLPSLPRTPREALVRVVRAVRRRWRLRVALRGLAITLAAAIPVVLLTAYGMDQFRFAPAAVWVFRLAAYGALLGIAGRVLVRPLVRRVSDEQVALYLEEHATLDGAVVSAVEFGARDDLADAPLVARVIERAVEQCAAVDGGRDIERPQLVRSVGVLGGATAAALILVLLHPGFLAHGVRFLLRPWGAGGAPPYAIAVSPGDVTVARGADVKVTAVLRNFDAPDVQLSARRGDAGEWERVPMVVDDESGEHVALLFDVRSATEYVVEASGVRSPLFRITVTDLPYVARLDLEYRFPDYTGLSPRREEDGGDVAALAGTRVTVSVTPTVPVTGGALVVSDTDTLALEPGADGRLSGVLRVAEPGVYRVALRAPSGALVTASPDYLIDVLEDQAPLVTLTDPGRDVAVTSIDEVFLEVTAEDDFGLARLELAYAVNGGPEQTVELYGGRGGRGGRREVVAGHTLYLEELALEPGDVIAYYARGTDRWQRRGQVTTSDIYFIEIRPFDQIYRQGDAQQGAMGGSGADVGVLSQRQREIVAATFNLVRDSAGFGRTEYRDNLGTLALAQGRLREEVETLVRRMEARGIVQLDSAFAVVAAALHQAAAAMQEAEERLGERTPGAALPPEQRALRQLQRAEAVFRERQVTRGGAPGARSAGGASAEELADLFELELDRERNQYEQLERGRRQEVDEQLQETEEKLRELARRQQQQNERMRARAQQGDPTGGAARRQRGLADETEELSRRLARLARERSRPDVAETARRLREAADAMRRAAASEGSAEGDAAAERLRDARRLLERARSAGLQRQAEDVLRRAERLADEEREMLGDVAGLEGMDGPARAARLRRLVERKNEMAGELEGLEAQLDRLARDARAEQPDAARELRAAAAGIRNDRLVDKIRYSRGVIQGRSPEYARNFEEQITADLERLRDRIRDAVAATGETRERRLAQNLDRARDMANALESLAERGSERTEAAEGAGDGGGAEGLRQLRRELTRRAEELSRLRGAFREDGIDVGQLDRLLGAMRRMDNTGAIGTPQGLDRLRHEIVQGLKEFEFAVRRELGLGQRAELRLTEADDVPAEYRALVEQYYRALAGERRP